MLRFTLGLLILAALCGCDRDDGGYSSSSGKGKTAAPIPAFVPPPLPQLLMDDLQYRRKHADHVEIESAFRLKVSADDLRWRLRQHQDLVERAIVCSRSLTGKLAPEPLEAGAQADTAQTRLVAHGRDLLLADAIRCWESGQPNECAERIGASLRMGAYLAGHDDPATKARGQDVLNAAVLELAGRIEDGLARRVSLEAGAELNRLLRAIDQKAIPQPAEGSAFGHALERSRSALLVN